MSSISSSSTEKSVSFDFSCALVTSEATRAISISSSEYSKQSRRGAGGGAGGGRRVLAVVCLLLVDEERALELADGLALLVLVGWL